MHAISTPPTAQEINALMKLCSVAGVMMLAIVGYDDAVARLKGTTGFIAKTMHGIQFKLERTN